MRNRNFYTILTPEKGATTIKKFTALLILFLSLGPIHFSAFADIDFKEEAAEDYRAQGYAEQSLGHFDQALSFYTKAATLGGQSAGLYNDIGVVYEQLGLPKQAERYYLKALETDSTYLPAYTNLAYIYKQSGDKPKAIEYLRRRIAAGPNEDFWVKIAKKELAGLDPAYRKELAVAVAVDSADKISQANKEAFVKKVEKIKQHYEQGELFLDERKYDQAVEEYQQALMLVPDNPRILNALRMAMAGQHMAEMRKRASNAPALGKNKSRGPAKEEVHNMLTGTDSNQTSD